MQGSKGLTGRTQRSRINLWYRFISNKCTRETNPFSFPRWQVHFNLQDFHYPYSKMKKLYGAYSLSHQPSRGLPRKPNRHLMQRVQQDLGDRKKQSLLKLQISHTYRATLGKENSNIKNNSRV